MPRCCMLQVEVHVERRHTSQKAPMSTRNSRAFQKMLNSTSTFSLLTALVQGMTVRAAPIQARNVRPAHGQCFECIRSSHGLLWRSRRSLTLCTAQVLPDTAIMK